MPTIPSSTALVTAPTGVAVAERTEVDDRVARAEALIEDRRAKAEAQRAARKAQALANWRKAYGERGEWAAQFVEQRPAGYESALSADGNIYGEWAIEEEDGAIIGGWDEPRYEQIAAYDAAIYIKLDQHPERDDVWYYPNSPDEIWAVRIDSTGKPITATLGEMDESGNPSDDEVYDAEWETDGATDVADEVLDLNTEERESGELYPYVSDGQVYIRYTESGTLKDEGPDPDTWYDERHERAERFNSRDYDY